MTYKAKAVANLFIDIARENKTKLDQMKLQKLVYISHGWFLALSQGRPLIEDEVCAWKYGPVLPILYDEFKNCGQYAITDYATDFRIDNDDFSVIYETPTVDKEDSETRSLADEIWKMYGKLTGPQLSNLTHMKGTPWDIVYSKSPHSTIPDNLIQQHFEKLIDNR